MAIRSVAARLRVRGCRGHFLRGKDFSPRISYVPLYIFARRYGGLNGSQRGHLSSLLDGFSRETQVVETFPLRPAIFLPGSHLFQQVSSTSAMLLGNFVHDFSRLPLTVRWPCIYITCM